MNEKTERKATVKYEEDLRFNIVVNKKHISYDDEIEKKPRIKHNKNRLMDRDYLSKCYKEILGNIIPAIEEIGYIPVSIEVKDVTQKVYVRNYQEWTEFNDLPPTYECED